MIPKIQYPKALRKLVKKYLKGSASKQEVDFVEQYYSSFDHKEGFLSNLSQSQQNELEEANLNAIQSKLSLTKPRNYQLYYKFAAAAAVLVLAIGTFFYLQKQPKENTAVNPLVAIEGKLDVLPGVNRATLTLSDGSKVSLGDKKSEDILSEVGLKVAVNANGELIYQVDRQSTAKETKFHTLETTKGNQFQIVLSDGTKVWLNALSSLHFPETFGNRRVVELSGEGYFEVAKDASHPFIVKTQKNGIKQEVEVLGTSFNINSYLDEPVIKTTLIEGSVKIANQSTSAVLKPMLQAKVNDHQIVMNQVDIDSEIAWKNGLFSFNNASLKSILSQIGRWYNIDIDPTKIPQKRFNGVISRNVNLSEVLRMLSLTGNIRIELKQDRTLSVYEN